MTCGIYRITNTVNGKIYIGQSVDIEKRWQRHKSLGQNRSANPESKYPLYLAMKKYGIDNFIFEILEECDQQQLNDKEELYIQKHKSDNYKYGYNCRKCFGRTKITEDKLQIIFDLLVNSSLTFTEIAGEVQVATTVISKINQGDLHKKNQDYPVRDDEAKHILRVIADYANKRLIAPLPPIDFRKNCNIGELVEYYSFQEVVDKVHSREYLASRNQIAKQKRPKKPSKKKNKTQRKQKVANTKLPRCPKCGGVMSYSSKSVCRQCQKKHREESILLPEEDVSLELIKRILDSSLDAVAHEYGYTSGNAVKKILKKHNMPSTKQEMYRYYEEQTGSKHPKEEMKEKKYQAAKEHKRHTHARKVGQFDFDMHLVAVFSSTKHATKITGISNSKIVNCCNGDLRQTGGYIFRYLAADDAPIAPDDLLDYEWNTSCSICGSDTESVTADFCPRCEHARRMVSSELSLEMLLELLSVYPLAQLSRLLACDPKTLYARFARLGMSKSEVRELNRRNNERRRS